MRRTSHNFLKATNRQPLPEQRLQGGKLVCCPEDYPILTSHFRTKLAVVEVHPGENQEDAWRRHLAANPEAARTRIKIFHYPGPRPQKRPKEAPEILFLPKKENLS